MRDGIEGQVAEPGVVDRPVVRVVDGRRPGLDVEAVGERLAEGLHPAARPAPGLEHGDLVAGLGELVGRGEAGQPGAHDEHPPPWTRGEGRREGAPERPGGEGRGGEEAPLQESPAAEIVTHEGILSWPESPGASRCHSVRTTLRFCHLLHARLRPDTGDNGRPQKGHDQRLETLEPHLPERRRTEVVRARAGNPGGDLLVRD